MSMDFNERNKLRRYLKVSAGLHAGFLLLMVVGEFISPGAGEIFQPSVQIDMVALPDLVKAQNRPVDTTLPVKEAPPPAPPEPEEKEAEPESKPDPKPKAEDPDLMALKKEKDAQNEAKKALERLRAQMKKDQKAEAKKREEQINEREKNLKKFEETYRAAIKGNQTNQGSSATGAMLEARNAYFGHIVDRVRGRWALPAFLQGKGFRAVVRMYVDSRGNAIRYTVVRSSGNEAFDSQAVGAIKEASPFAAPPAEMSNGLRNNGLELEFPL